MATSSSAARAVRLYVPGTSTQFHFSGLRQGYRTSATIHRDPGIISDSGNLKPVKTLKRVVLPAFGLPAMATE